MPELVSQGLNLAALGMGTVFVFLSLLILAIQMMSMVLAPADIDAPAPVSPDSSIGAKKMAAISAAIHEHRNSQ